MRFAWVGLPQIRHAFSLDGGDHNILVTMDFLLAAVVQSLFFGLFWPLAASFRAIDDGSRRIFLTLLRLLEFLRVSFWQKPKILQSLLKNGQQAMDPFIRLRLTHPEQLTHHRLQRVAFLVHQRKQQFLLDAGQRSFATRSNLSLSSLSCLRFDADTFSGRLAQRQVTDHQILLASDS